MYFFSFCGSDYLRNFLQKLNEKLVNEKETIYSKIYSNAILYFDTNTIQAIGGTINYFSGTPKHNYNNEEYLNYLNI